MRKRKKGKWNLSQINIQDTVMVLSYKISENGQTQMQEDF